jgi:hypothetical protein
VALGSGANLSPRGETANMELEARCQVTPPVELTRGSRGWSRMAEAVRMMADARGAEDTCRAVAVRDMTTEGSSDPDSARVMNTSHRMGWGSARRLEDQVGVIKVLALRKGTIALPRNAMRLICIRAVALRRVAGIALAIPPVALDGIVGRLTYLLSVVGLLVEGGGPLVGSGGPFRLPRSRSASGGAARACAARRLCLLPAALATVMLGTAWSRPTRRTRLVPAVRAALLMEMLALEEITAAVAKPAGLRWNPFT